MNFSVFPNLFLDKLELEINGFELLENSVLNVSILNGQQTVTIHLQSEKETIFSISKLAKEYIFWRFGMILEKLFSDRK